MAEESQYAYFQTPCALFRVNIPLSDNEEFKIETVFHNPSNPLPIFMGIFSHDDTVYMVGGQIGYSKEYNRSIYVFDPKRFQKLPVDDLNSLDTTRELPTFKLMAPYVIQSGSGRIYFLTWEPLGFHSFDPTENHFENLPSPRDYGIVNGYFLLGDYIYLFISKPIGSSRESAFTFNTRSSEWEERKELVHQFVEKKIPIPHTCIGDVGLSDELADKSRIMVTLAFGNPIAYCIHLGEDGSLRPNSYRRLYELFNYREYTEGFESIYLLDIRGGRFFVIYQNDDSTPLMIYVFKIDFEEEHRIQISSIKEKNPSSVQVLSSMKLEDSIPLLYGRGITALCLASATSNEDRDMAAACNEGQDMAVTSNEGRDMAATSNESGDMAATSNGGGDMANSSFVASCSPFGPKEYINHKSMAELAESQYAYFQSQLGLFRFNIPLFDNQFEIELVLSRSSNLLPYCMGLFSHNHKIYMAGGQIGNRAVYSDSVYIFDPNKFKKLPVPNPKCLDKPKGLCGNFESMMDPYVIRSEDRIYFLFRYDYFCNVMGPLHFQSFDLINNEFKPLTSPPYEVGYGTVTGYFCLCGYIYLIIVEEINPDFNFHIFTFNTRSSKPKWKERKKLLDQFVEKKFPLPDSIGDVGLSHEFPDKSRILITLNDRKPKPTAYRIHLCDDGFLRPNSYRCLDEIFIDSKYRTEDWCPTRLLDIGGGRFCFFYQNYTNMPLMIYIFKIDFEVEHSIQISEVKESNTSSLQCLSSKIFKEPLCGRFDIGAICFDIDTNNEGRDMAATSNEDKDVDKKNKIKSVTSKRGGRKYKNRRN